MAVGERVPAVLLALLLAGCIQVGTGPSEQGPPTLYGNQRVPDGVVPADPGNSRGPAASASPVDDACNGPGPARQVGDEWWYRNDTTLPSHYKIEARETMHGRDTFRINLTMSEIFYTIPGFAEDPRYQLLWVCAGNGAEVSTLDVWNRTTRWETLYEQPCPWIRYPVQAGSHWSVSCPYQFARGNASGVWWPYSREVTVAGNSTWPTEDGIVPTFTVWTNVTRYGNTDLELSEVSATSCAQLVYVHRESKLSLRHTACKA